MGTLLAELRRRRVFRALLGWGVVSFAVLQVSEPLMHALELPDWTLKAAVAVLAAGFPATVVLAWFFDLTRAGVSRTADVPVAGEAGPGGRSRFAPLLAATALAGALGGAGLAWWLRGHRDHAPPPGKDGRVVVAVADFANRTGEQELDDLSGLLITSLEQSRQLAVFTRVRMIDELKKLGKRGVDVVDEPLAREVGRAAGIRALVLATVRRFDATYTVDLKVLDPATSDYLFTLKETVRGKAAVPDLVDRLSERTRDRLLGGAAAPPAHGPALGEATTRNLEAWHHYVQGQKEEAAYHSVDAAAAYRRAVAADPGFALAQFRLAYVGRAAGVPEEERGRALQAALRKVAVMPARERALFLAWRAWEEDRDEEARRLHDRAVRDFPEDKDILHQAGVYHWAHDRWPEAVAVFRRLLALDPGWMRARDHIVGALNMMRRLDESLALCEQAVREAPSAIAHADLAWTLMFLARFEEAVAAARRATEMDDQPWTRGLWGWTLLAAGRLEEAEGTFRGIPEHRRWSGPAPGGLGLVATLAHQGRRREASRVLAEVVARRPPSSEETYLNAAYLRSNLLLCTSCGLELAEVRREAEAAARRPANRGWAALLLLLHGDEAAAEELAAGIPDEVTWADVSKAQWPGLRSWRGGDGAQARAALERLAAAGPPHNQTVPTYLLALLARREGRDADVVEAADRHARAPRIVLGTVTLPEVTLWAAEALERMGRSAEARERVDRLLGWWSRADPDLPLLAEAKALKRRLEARARAPERRP
jgi:tetratricopeptide (TPR) repeat protein